MMSIIVSSDSIHKGRRHVERIMDAWLPRLSSTVWGGYLSREGVKKIIEELNDCGRGVKNTMAVSIIWEHDHRFEQIAFVGNRKRLSDGLAALGKAKSRAATRPMPDFVKALSLTARLAGKAHDLGKATDDYQKWFRGGERDISVRHERISALILNNLLMDGASSLDDAEPHRQSISLSVLPFWQAAALAAVATHHGKRDNAFSKIESALELLATPKQLSERLADDLKSLSKRLRERDMPEDTFPLSLFSSRISLMLGDYAQSSYETTLEYSSEGEWHDAPRADAIYAKSRPLVPLEAHLTSVASRAANIARSIFMHDWPKFAVHEKPEIMKQTPKGRFAWQGKAEYMIRRLGLSEHDAAFVVLAAETGSGKTLGGYRIMSALRDDQPRFNFAVGFGALAVQTEAEYREKLGLTQDQMALVVGKRFEKKGDKKNEDEFEEVIEVLHGRDDDIPDSLKEALTLKSRKIIATPIVVTTIDHLASASSSDKGDSILSALRLAVSDTFIDEIDSFDALGLHVIARMAYISGMYGRHLVISSATVTPEIVSMLHDAWQSGYLTYQKVFGGKSYAALITNISNERENLSRVFSGDNIDSLITHMNHIGKVISDRSEESPRFLNVLNLERGSEEQQYEQIFETCLKIAVEHYDENLSGGFVLFNTATDAQKFTLWLHDHLSNSEYDFNVRLTCYTSRLSRKNRQKIERFLGELYDRNSNDWKFSEHYARLTEGGKRKCIHIVATTSIMGVGRDYDFDWCIIEPSTEKALIQAAGRIMRHRLRRPDSVNIYMIKSTLYALTSKKDLKGANLFEGKSASPVSGDPLKKEGGAPQKVIQPLKSLKIASEGFALKQHARGITTGFRLGEPASIIDEVDRKYIEYVHHECHSNRAQKRGTSIARFLHEVRRKDTSNPFIGSKFDSIKLREQDISQTIKLDETEKNIEHIELDNAHLFAYPLRNEPDDEIVLNHVSSSLAYSPNIGHFSKGLLD